VVSWTEVFDLASQASASLQIFRGTAFAAFFFAPALAHAAAHPHRGAALVRIEVPTPATIASLEAAGIEPWPDHPSPPSVVARVPARSRAWLDASGLRYDVVTPDLEISIEVERQRLSGRTPAAGTPEMFEEFRDLSEIEAHMDVLAALAPGDVTLVQIGTSIEGRPIRGLRIERAPGEPKPLVLVNATQHAREWIATMAALYVADTLVAAEPGDASIDALLDEVAVLVVPVVNPDGYVHTWTEDRFWRKNRRDEHGVDLNRNHPIAWGAEGSSFDPEDGNYRGAAPLSEPESVALAELLDLEPSLVAVLDVHSFGQLVLSPWSFTLDPPPADRMLIPLGATIAETMAQPWHTEYTPQHAADLYLAAGTWPDHAYAARGAWSYTLELQPAEAEMFTEGFVLPAEAIVECGEEVLAALVVLAAGATESGVLAPGDDGDAPGPLEPPEGTAGQMDGESGGGPGDAGASTSSDAPPEPDATGPMTPETSSATTGSTGESEPEVAPGSSIDEVRSSCACRARPGGDGLPLWIFGAALGWPRRRFRASSRSR
jgi:hypothetical protein